MTFLGGLAHLFKVDVVAMWLLLRICPGKFGGFSELGVSVALFCLLKSCVEYFFMFFR